MKKVVVAMSGGVDSSVAAYLLKKQGYDCVGLFMKNWEEEPCPAAQDFEDVASVCEKLQIPYYAVNFAKEYKEAVFNDFVRDYRAGHTPNPDILCNREIKFKVLMNKALEMGADFLATGHYARNLSGFLGRGLDSTKDQSYFLYTLTTSILDKVLFPVGELKKSEVRAIAHELALSTAAKKDSTGICFIGERNFREFLSNYIKPRPGPLMTLSGTIVGTHSGSYYYTIGQRKGLAIGGAGEAWFVVGKDTERNIVFVEQGDHPALFSYALTADAVSWVAGPPDTLRCTAKIRYRQPDSDCTVTIQENGTLMVTFDTPQKAVTPRQSVVFYQGEVCLGGAAIISAYPAPVFQALHTAHKHHHQEV
jgi:tRNA-specific 2-thiouridylase